MGDYVDNRGVGRNFTPAQLDREAAKRKIESELQLKALLTDKGFIQTHSNLSIDRYVRKKDDSVLLLGNPSNTWMHNVALKPAAEGRTLEALLAYLKMLA